MRRFIAIGFFCAVGLFLTGCVNVSYVGEAYAPTMEVKYFFHEKDIPKDTYRTIGRATASLNEDEAIFLANGAISDALRKKAMEVGADAIFVKDQYRHKVGTYTSGSSSTYYKGRSRTKGGAVYGPYGGYGRHKTKTKGRSHTYSSETARDIIREEIHAEFLKRIK